MTRRSFLYGALGVATVAAVGGGIFGATQCSKDASNGSDAESVGGTNTSGAISVATDKVFTTENCEYVEDLSQAVTLVAQAHLPYGTMLWADDDALAACLLPCDTSIPLAQVGVISFETGQLTHVLDKAVAQDEGFNIYDVRANSRGAVWIEADILNGTWRIYTAELNGALSGSPFLGPAALAAEGTSEWDTPEIAIAGEYAFWQMCPNAKGPLKKENSLLERIAFGRPIEEAKTVYESGGRFACSPSSTSDGIVIAPRAETKGTYYQLTHLDASSGEIIDAMLLPSAMTPTFVSYGDTGFSFAFDSIYNYGDGISGLGTYTPATGQPGGSGEWFRFARTPLTEPAWCGKWFVVKSTSVVAGIDLANKRYFSMSPEHATQGYGEFLASSGTGEKFVTYSNIDYTPLNGERITECNVRVWKSA